MSQSTSRTLGRQKVIGGVLGLLIVAVGAMWWSASPTLSEPGTNARGVLVSGQHTPMRAGRKLDPNARHDPQGKSSGGGSKPRAKASTNAFAKGSKANAIAGALRPGIDGSGQGLRAMRSPDSLDGRGGSGGGGGSGGASGGGGGGGQAPGSEGSGTVASGTETVMDATP